MVRFCTSDSIVVLRALLNMDLMQHTSMKQVELTCTKRDRVFTVMDHNILRLFLNDQILDCMISIPSNFSMDRCNAE